MSDFSYTLGTEYGYVFPLSSRFSLDLSVAFGYFGGKYKVYDPIDTHYVWQESRFINKKLRAFVFWNKHFKKTFAITCVRSLIKNALFCKSSGCATNRTDCSPAFKDFKCLFKNSLITFSSSYSKILIVFASVLFFDRNSARIPSLIHSVIACSTASSRDICFT